MRVLLDECLDWRLGRELPEHEVKTARQMGWSGVTNGELLTLAKTQFDAFVTVDSNLSFQQNLSTYSIGIVVLRVRRIRLPDLRPLVPALKIALAEAQPGKPIFLDGRNSSR